MTEFEIWALAVALSIDCLAVSLASGIILQKIQWKPILLMSFSFGFFQALTPLLGWLGTYHFKTLLESVDHWIAFGILAFLGIRMIVESFKQEEEKTFNPRSLKVILTMAIATSIDALAVGISFACMGIHDIHTLSYPLYIIGFVSFVVSLTGLLMGIGCGKRIAAKIHADRWGGVILIGIGIKVLIEHLST